ncbi:MAG TPA: hypothetical protein VLV54_16550 [Thermoanaerobaculia bacterium]|nr:hypothetical protein [Thermoanaerobaculia bacterium]
MRKWLVFGLLVLTSLACRGDGDDGLTFPSALPQVAGKWIGDWETNGDVFHPEINFSQKKSRLSGTFSLDSTSVPIMGSVDMNLGVQWTIGSAGCASLNGNGKADSLSTTRINGTINLSDCDHQFTGPVVWRRSSKQTTASPPSAGSTLKDLVAWMRRSARR